MSYLQQQQPKTGYLICNSLGAISPANNTITTIITTNVPNWQSVTNTSILSLGSEEEDDVSYYNQGIQRINKNSNSMVGSVESKVLDLNNVKQVKTTFNNTNTAQTIDGVLIPANSIYIIVNGDTDINVATAIYSAQSCNTLCKCNRCYQ